MEDFSHIEDERAQMVDVTSKEESKRIAKATGKIELKEKTIKKIKEKEILKGNVLSVARVAGIQAVKKTWEDIPMCHQIPITGVSINFELKENYIESSVEVKSKGKTGTEMEALNGVSRSLLTIWDMVKSSEKTEEGRYPTTSIKDIEVKEKNKK